MRYYANTARVGSDLSRVPGLFLSLEYISVLPTAHVLPGFVLPMSTHRQ